jgi:pimeloyl-ACP methyl ester carboxylesterase
MNYLIQSYGKWAYQKTGHGEEVFLVFHGFGQTHQEMMAFDQLRKPGQVFLFFDLFYHGKSHWADSSKEFNPQIWIDFIRLAQQKEGFEHFHLISYSMGGKFALLTFEVLPKEVKSLILIAPDGIKTGLWYSMTNYPNYIHPVFKRVVFKPKRFFGIVEGLNFAGLIEKSLVKFVKTQLESRSKRAQAYFVWKVFGSVQLQLGKIIRLAREKPELPITLFIGEFDKMVTAENLKRFSNKIPHLKTVSLPVGHGRLIQAAVDYLKA